MSTKEDDLSDDRRFYSHRLSRIEEKIDEFGKILISIARTEEKVAAIEEERERQWEKLNKMEAKMDIMESKMNDAARTVSIIHKLFWVTVAGAISYLLPTLLQTIML